MSYYAGRIVTRYFSKLEEDRGFDSPEDARAYDRLSAAQRLDALTKAQVQNALDEGDRYLARLLRFAVDEIEDAGLAARGTEKAETA